MATNPLDFLGLPLVPGAVDKPPVPQIRNCQTCRNKPTCVPYKQGGAFLQAMGFTSTTPTRKSYGAGAQKVSAPTAAMLPMGCGGNAWEPTETKPPELVQRFFEDYVPTGDRAAVLKTNPLSGMGDKGLPM